MGRKRFRYNPNWFDQHYCVPYGVRSGLLKPGDIVYRGRSYGNNIYIYTKDGILLGFCSPESLEKI